MLRHDFVSQTGRPSLATSHTRSVLAVRSNDPSSQSETNGPCLPNAQEAQKGSQGTLRRYRRRRRTLRIAQEDCDSEADQSNCANNDHCKGIGPCRVGQSGYEYGAGNCGAE